MGDWATNKVGDERFASKMGAVAGRSVKYTLGAGRLAERKVGDWDMTGRLAERKVGNWEVQTITPPPPLEGLTKCGFLIVKKLH